jgi:hypothetical protein
MELLERLNTIATVKENEMVQGIEVYFDTKPSYDIISELKENKFRWHNVKKCWYVKKSLLSESTAKEEERKEVKEMKHFTLLTKEETKELAKTLWDSESMQDFIVDKYDFYRTNDGLILELEKVKKISIDKTIWYDDETEAPTLTEALFVRYNMSNEPSRSLENYLEEAERLRTQGCASGRYDYEGIYFIQHYEGDSKTVSCHWSDEKDKYFKRYLTQEEQQEYIELMEERKNQYIERVKSYYKRYNKHIHVSGYWANR